MEKGCRGDSESLILPLPAWPTLPAPLLLRSGTVSRGRLGLESEAGAGTIAREAGAGTGAWLL